MISCRYQKVYASYVINNGKPRMHSFEELLNLM